MYKFFLTSQLFQSLVDIFKIPVEASNGKELLFTRMKFSREEI